MFVFKRSAAAVLLPLLLLMAVVTWSNRPAGRGGAVAATTVADTRTSPSATLAQAGVLSSPVD